MFLRSPGGRCPNDRAEAVLADATEPVLASNAYGVQDAPVEHDGESEVMQQMRLRWEARVRAAQEFLQQQPLVGLSVEEAAKRAHEAGAAFRDADLAHPILSADMQPGRITAMVQHGVVVSAEVGN